jgi:SAM-dependent methyltransferase
VHYNFRSGELAFRGAFDEALVSMGARVPDGGLVVDLGCASGISTRRIATNWPEAQAVLGIDLSPHFLAVGNRLLQLGRERANAASAEALEWQWVNDWTEYADERVSLRRGDAAATGLAEASVDVVSVSLVIHELPPDATIDVAAEAMRILKPGGQLWLTEMDFETEGFSKLRANPVLFSLIRATEPYLDVYADFMPTLPAALSELGFTPVRLAAATGRHFACVATKPTAPVDAAARVVDDQRKATAKPDTHLKTWEAKRR